MQLLLEQSNHNSDLHFGATTEMVTAMPERKSNVRDRWWYKQKKRLYCEKRINQGSEGDKSLASTFACRCPPVLSSFCHYFTIYNPGYSWLLCFFFVRRVVGCFPIADWLWEHDCSLKLWKVLRHWKTLWIQTIHMWLSQAQFSHRTGDGSHFT